MRAPFVRLALVLSSLAVSLVPATGGSPAAATTAHNPVIFVHGFNGSPSSFDTMVAAFEQHGWTAADLFAWSYDSHQSNETTAGALATEVDTVLRTTGATRVDLVTHSMGGLPSRWYLKYLGGQAKVDHWVSLGGPNHGTNLAPACLWLLASCRDMVPGSSFLTRLNTGDETPGAVKYSTFWSSCDEIISPHSSVLLAGATNTAAGCLEHAQMTSTAALIAQVWQSLS